MKRKGLVQSKIELKEFKSYSKGMEHAVDNMNKWVQEVGDSIELINIETIMDFSGGGMTSIDASAAGVRVWYWAK